VIYAEKEKKRKDPERKFFSIGSEEKKRVHQLI